MLVLDEPCTEESQIYFFFVALYVLALGYALYTLVLLFKYDKKSGFSNIHAQHTLVAISSAFRIMTGLNNAGVLGELPAAASGLMAAVPYILETVAFSLLAATWAAVVHFSMKRDAFAKVKPYFLALNFVTRYICVSCLSYFRLFQISLIQRWSWSFCFA